MLTHYYFFFPVAQSGTTAQQVLGHRFVARTAPIKTSQHSRCVRPAPPATSVTTLWTLSYWTTPLPSVALVTTVQLAHASGTSFHVQSAHSTTGQVCEAASWSLWGALIFGNMQNLYSCRASYACVFGQSLHQIAKLKSQE